jgi:hypothetical protein
MPSKGILRGNKPIFPGSRNDAFEYPVIAYDLKNRICSLIETAVLTGSAISPGHIAETLANIVAIF